VVAEDLAPELLVAGRQHAGEMNVEVDWREADAEAMPFADAGFDTVMSYLGVMFAPHHQAAADELLRVCRRGGIIGLISWTPAGFIGQMFAL
jgi:ubiquinone/menaquinone biosynthesis C-methylase UbiE